MPGCIRASLRTKLRKIIEKKVKLVLDISAAIVYYMQVGKS